MCQVRKCSRERICDRARLLLAHRPSLPKLVPPCSSPPSRALASHLQNPLALTTPSPQRIRIDKTRLRFLWPASHAYPSRSDPFLSAHWPFPLAGSSSRSCPRLARPHPFSLTSDPIHPFPRPLSPPDNFQQHPPSDWSSASLVNDSCLIADSQARRARSPARPARETMEDPPQPRATSKLVSTILFNRSRGRYEAAGSRGGLRGLAGGCDVREGRPSRFLLVRFISMLNSVEASSTGTAALERSIRTDSISLSSRR